jgi:hypothetical protein
MAQHEDDGRPVEGRGAGQLQDFLEPLAEEWNARRWRGDRRALLFRGLLEYSRAGGRLRRCWVRPSFVSAQPRPGENLLNVATVAGGHF